MFTATFRFFVVLAHRLFGWVPPYKPAYYWFFEDPNATPEPSQEEMDAAWAELERFQQEENLRLEEEDNLRWNEEQNRRFDEECPQEVQCSRCGAYCEASGNFPCCADCEAYYEESDRKEAEFLRSEFAPDDAWRYDHLGSDPL